MTEWQLFFLFCRSVALTFGGGYAVISILQNELVQNLGVLTSAEFGNMLALAQLTPGPVGLNTATYVGYQQLGLSGALAGTAGVVVPCLILGCLGAYFFHSSKKSRFYQSAMRGIRPVVLGLIFSAVAVLMESSVLTAPLSGLWGKGEIPQICPQGALIFTLVLVVEWKWKVSFLWLLCGAGLLGFLLFL